MKNKTLILSRNIIINFSSYFIVLLATFFTTPYILKTLGKTQYGLLIFLTTIINFLLSLEFGFSFAFVQKLAKKIGSHENITLLFWTGFYLYLLISLFWALLIFLSAPLLLRKIFPISQQAGNSAIYYLRIFSFILLFTSWSNFSSLSFRALQKFHLANLQLIISGSLIPLGTFYLLKNGFVLKEIIYFYLLVNASTAILLFFLLKKNLSLKIKPVFSWQLFKELFSFAKWQFLSQLAGQIRQKASRFFLIFYLSLNKLPFFTIPQNLGQRYVSLLPNITSPIFTMTAYLTGENKQKELLKLYSLSVKLINILILPLGTFLFFYGQSFLSLWISPNFGEKSGIILKILIIGFSVFILNGLPNVFLTGKGKPQLPSKISIFIVSLFLLFSWLLIPHFGLLGAALATTIPYLIQSPIYPVIATKKINQQLKASFFINNYFYPLILNIGVGWIFYLFKKEINYWPNFFFYLLLFLIVNWLLVFIFQILNKEEKKLILHLWKYQQLS